ncbi:MAG: hypothetical protein ACLQPD_26175 [Desulfomonilaceae bacterium]
MKRILIVIAAIALVAMSYGPGNILSRTADHLGGVQSWTAITPEVLANSGFMPSSLIYLCAENGGGKDDSGAKKGDGDEEKPEKEVPGIDRMWDVAMYG